MQRDLSEYNFLDVHKVFPPTLNLRNPGFGLLQPAVGSGTIWRTQREFMNLTCLVWTAKAEVGGVKPQIFPLTDFSS